MAIATLVNRRGKIDTEAEGQNCADLHTNTSILWLQENMGNKILPLSSAMNKSRK